MIRRFTILGLSLVLLAVALGGSSGNTLGGTMSMDHPNIIFILADDLDAQSIAVMPQLKSLLTDQGVSFSNFFVSFSLCCPSRTTILRGQYAQNTQIFGNTPPNGGYERFHSLGEESDTIATWLQAAGYKTMLAGKYLNGYPESAAPTYIPPGWSEWYSPAQGNAYSEFNYTLNENGKLVRYGNQEDDYGTDVYASKTIGFIQRAVQEGKPFFAYLSTYAPHSPATPAPRHQNLFLTAKAPRTPNYNETDVRDKPAYIRNRPLLTTREMAQIDEQYRKRLQSLQAVDEAIGEIIETLKATGKLDSTYIFFSSDNGYHLGNHRLGTGKIAPYEEDIRVPLIVRGPGIPIGQTVDLLAGNVDLAPTWAELAGVKAADFVDGRSLVPLLGSSPPSADAWRQAYLLVNGDLNQSSQTDSNASGAASDTKGGLLEPEDPLPLSAQAQAQGLGIPAFRGIRTADHLYVEYATGERELYDLRSDPYELQNLQATADPSLLSQLSSRLSELKNCAAASCRAAESVALGTTALATLAQPPPGSQGPYFHQIYSASSPDGLNWSFDNRLLLNHGSVPAAIASPEGNIRIYYVDATQPPETTNCAESRDGGLTFTVLGCTIANRAGEKAVDPSIVQLTDGRYRLYYYASARNPDAPGTHSIYSAVSEDGVHFTQEQEVFSYPGLVDPDVFWTGEEWLMYVFSLSDGATVVARSSDGLNFEYVGPLPLRGWGTTAPVRLDDGRFRLYAFDQRTSQTVASFLSTDGLMWAQEEGVRLSAPVGQEITDPFVVRLPDGSWKMIYKVSPARSR